MDARGEGMAATIAATDWTNTPLGSRAGWTPALRHTLDNALNSHFGVAIYWGREFIQLYNDALIPMLGAKHPSALGRPARECWPEIWDSLLHPLCERTMYLGEPYFATDQHVRIDRDGTLRDAYFTFGYSRINDPDSAGGVLITVLETTSSVLYEREFRAMADAVAGIMYSQSAAGRIEWTNSRWASYSRLPEEQRHGSEGWVRCIPEKDIAASLALRDRSLADGLPYEIEVRIKPCDADDGAYRVHLVQVAPVRDPAGTIVRWVGTAIDIHDRRVAEIALRERLEEDLEREHLASLAFQNAALPHGLPSIAGVGFDAIYGAAVENTLVGGDWYDAFCLPDGRVALSIGDVMGSGLPAAVTMAGVRQAIRGAAQIDPSPVRVLDAADRALRSEQPDRIVTAFFGVFNPSDGSLVYASAGHPPPFVRAPNGEVAELGSFDLPLGLRGYASQDNATVVDVGSLIVLYTDGLTEATRDLLAGEARVREAIAETPPSASRPAEHIWLAVRTATVGEIGRDDVAILTVAFLEAAPRSIAAPRATR